MTQFSFVTIPKTEIRTLKSAATNQEYQIFVGFPDHYLTSPKAFPVLYMLDANIGFGIVEFIRMLQHVQEVPEFLLVGIGYPVSHFVETLELRQRDYTPTVDKKVAAQTPASPQGGKPANIGRATNFLQCIGEELVPFIEENYRVVAGDRGIVGVSLGGLFALYTLFHQPNLFNRYIIVSPSIWWGDGITFEYEHCFAATHTDLKAHVFMSAGSLEDEDIKDNVIRLSEQLRQRNYNGFHLRTQILEDETHVSGVASAICKGIREVYRK